MTEELKPIKKWTIIKWCFVALLIMWGVSYHNVWYDYFFGAQHEANRRAIFQESKAYTQGMQQDLENIYREYQTAAPENKAAIRSVVQHRYVDYPVEKLPTYLRLFVEEVRR